MQKGKKQDCRRAQWPGGSPVIQTNMSPQHALTPHKTLLRSHFTLYHLTGINTRLQLPHIDTRQACCGLLGDRATTGVEDAYGVFLRCCRLQRQPVGSRIGRHAEPNSIRSIRAAAATTEVLLSELGNYGSLPKLQILTIDGTVLQSDSVGKTVFYAAFINDAHRASRKNLSALFNQFKDRVDYTFLLVDGDSNEEGFKRQQDGAKFYHFVAPSATIDSICGLFAKDEQAPMMLMSDTKGNIRNFYKSFESYNLKLTPNYTTLKLN